MTLEAKYKICGKQSFEGTLLVPSNYFDETEFFIGEPPNDDVLDRLLNGLGVSKHEVMYWSISPID